MTFGTYGDTHTRTATLNAARVVYRAYRAADDGTPGEPVSMAIPMNLEEAKDTIASLIDALDNQKRRRFESITPEGIYQLDAHGVIVQFKLI